MTRETDDDWKALGETEPWYGVLSAPEFLQANITDEAKDRFYLQGQQEMAWVVETLTTHFSPFEPQVGADFGSGLGRLSFPMSGKCGKVYGIDVSPGMRAEAANQATLRDMQNVEFVDALPPGTEVDWVNSYIVFQHIVPRTGYHLLSNLLGHLRIGGFVSIQITFAHDHRDNQLLSRDLATWRFDGETLTVLEEKSREVGDMSMYDYDMNRVLMIFARIGVRDLFMRHTDHGGVHGFWVFGRKTF